jgi:hypothetical protein
MLIDETINRINKEGPRAKGQRPRAKGQGLGVYNYNAQPPTSNRYSSMCKMKQENFDNPPKRYVNYIPLIVAV